MPFNPTEYLARRADLVANWDSDPGYANVYGTIENYALADAAAWGTPEEKAQIQAMDIVAPPGQTLEPGPNQAPGTNNNQPISLEPNTTTGPAERQLWDLVSPRAVDDIVADSTVRQPIADAANKTIEGAIGTFNGLNNQLIPQLDFQKYLADNPDVAQSYEANKGPDGFAMVNGQRMNPQQFAQYHYDTYGKAEMRPASFVSQRLTDENKATSSYINDLISAANQRDATQREATAAGRSALDQATANRVDTMNAGTNAARVSLQRDLNNQVDAQRAATATARAGLDAATEAALNERYAGTDVATGKLNEALTSQYAAQRAGTTQATAERNAALQAQLAARRAAIDQEAADLEGVVGEEADARRAALAKNRAELDAAQNTYSGARLSNLNNEIQALRGVAGESAAARRAALEQEANEIRAAQDPLNAARLAAAETQGSTINQALERTLDSIVARQAEQGFVGTDSFTDSALLRATLEARQGAAGAVQGARVDNAADDRSIAVRTANQRRGIDDELARTNESIGQRSATGTRTLEDERAGGLNANATMFSNDGRAISDNLAGARSAIGQNRARATGILAGYGADEGRIIANQGTDRNLGLVDAEAADRTGVTKFGVERNLGILDAGATDKQNNAKFSVSRNLASDDLLSGDTREIGKWGTARDLDVIDMAGKEWSDNARWGVDRNVATSDQKADAIAGAQGTGATLRLESFNNDLPRSLNAALRPISLVGDQINSRNALDNYANSGTMRGLNLLNSFGGNSSAPTPNPFVTTPNTTMADFWGNTAGGVMNIAGNYLLGSLGKTTPTTKLPATQVFNGKNVPAGSIGPTP